MAVIGTSNVTMSAIRDALNAAGGSVNNNLVSFFSANAKINHWAKYKPVRYEGDFPSRDEYWKAYDGNCGFTPLQLTSYTQIPSKMDGVMNGWVYNLPTGGSKYPFRLGDFRGYDTNAYPMVRNLNVPAQASNQFTSASFRVDATVSPSGGSSITLADLSLGNYYAGVLVVNSSGTIKKVAIGNSVSGGSFVVDVPCYDLSAGTYTCYPFLSANKTVGSAGDKFYTLPNVQAKNITIVTSMFSIAILATRATNGSRAVNYTISITNGSTAVTWTNNTYKLRFFGKEFSDPTLVGEKNDKLTTSPINVAANTTTTITGTISDISVDLWNKSSMELWVSFNSGAHIERTSIANNDRT
ncbi:MAG: hypothetical protein U0M06_02730 [Clostridia bacterium]|nr:hypothetical protein [Clostridia bacterium]